MISLYFTLVDEGDRDSFENIYRNYERKFFAYSMSVLHDKVLAEDAVSETFLSLAKNYSKVHKLDESEIVAYTFIINRNICFDIYKKEKKQTENVFSDDLIEQNYGASNQSDFDKSINADLVNSLPDIYKDVIMLKYFYGFSVSEIAKLIRLSVGGVKFRLSKARQMLREEVLKNESY